jgi:hypothetical protein
MEDKKTYEKPKVTGSVKTEGFAGSCTGGKGAGNGGGCAIQINS